MYHENIYFRPHGHTATRPHGHTATRPQYKFKIDVFLRHLLFPCCLFLIISSAIAQDPESGYIFDEIGYGYTPVSNTPVSNSSCSYVVDGTTLMPVRRDIQRCDAD